VQLLLVFVVPLVLLVWHWFNDAPSLRRGSLLGATLTFGVLACAYYGIMMGLAVGFAALWFAAGQAQARRYWLGLAAAVVVAAVLVAPLALPYATMRSEDGFRAALDVEEARGYSADHRTTWRKRAVIRPIIGRICVGTQGCSRNSCPGPGDKVSTATSAQREKCCSRG
jgi:hypothetical protein